MGVATTFATEPRRLLGTVRNRVRAAPQATSRPTPPSRCDVQASCAFQRAGRAPAPAALPAEWPATAPPEPSWTGAPDPAPAEVLRNSRPTARRPLRPPSPPLAPRTDVVVRRLALQGPNHRQKCHNGRVSRCGLPWIVVPSPCEGDRRWLSPISWSCRPGPRDCRRSPRTRAGRHQVDHVSAPREVMRGPVPERICRLLQPASRHDRARG